MEQNRVYLELIQTHNIGEIGFKCVTGKFGSQVRASYEKQFSW